MKTRLSQLVAEFERMCGSDVAPLQVARAPGRVNLIGEHTDYNGGFVLPIAIDRDVLMVGRRRSDRRVRLYSLDYQQLNEFSLDAIDFDTSMRWSNYVRGVFDVLQKEGYVLQGMEIAVTGDIPQGAGLSSSAALEVAAASLVSALCDLQIEPARMARLAQQAENRFVGVQCGIMDQFISRLGRQDHALLIDCRSLEYRHIPWQSPQLRLLVADTRVQRGLVDSEYNQRRQECEAGVRALTQALPDITALRDVSVGQFQEHAHILTPIVRSRCQHVVYENARVLEAVKALESGDWKRLGELMYASHESLRDLYQVSCPELDAMVEIARDVDGVYGARMTGGGFGGCAIALVEARVQGALEEAILRRYPQMTGFEPRLLLTGAADGARIWTWER